MSEKQIDTWIVKDVDGKVSKIRADRFQTFGADDRWSIKFYIGEEIVGQFFNEKSYYKESVSTKKVHEWRWYFTGRL